MCEPMTVGVYETLHVPMLLFPGPGDRVQLVALNVPVLLVVNVTVQVGVVGVVEVSMTRAVQVVAALMTTEPGEQVMLV